jgi:hydroxyacylglutathione hydrolase
MIVEQLQVGFMGAFCYIIGCGQEKVCAIIDPGGDEQKILARVEEIGCSVKYVINTHSHIDHTSGNRLILEKTGAELVIQENDSEDVLNLDSETLTMATWKLTSTVPRLLAKDGDVLKIGRVELLIMHTPGHTPGSICIYSSGNLFTGDTLFVGAVGRTDLKGGSFPILIQSLKKLMALPPETRVWPGHDYGARPVSTVAHEMETNPYITEFVMESGKNS